MAVGTALELGVELDSHKEGVAGDLHRLHQTTVGRLTAESQPSHLQLGPVLVVELIAVAVALVDLRRAVAVGHLRARRDDAGVLAQTHRAALRLNALLVRHQVNDVVLASGVNSLELASA